MITKKAIAGIVVLMFIVSVFISLISFPVQIVVASPDPDEWCVGSGCHAWSGNVSHNDTMVESDKVKLNDILDFSNITVHYFDDFEDGNLNEYYFGGDADWLINNTDAFRGAYCAQSGDISDSQTTSIKKNFTFTENVTVSWVWRQDSEVVYDYLEFYVNNSLKTTSKRQRDNITYSDSWNVDVGDWILEWRYMKDSGSSEGRDAGWIDYILIYSLPLDNEGWICEVENADGANLNSKFHKQNHTTYLEKLNNLDIDWGLGVGKLNDVSGASYLKINKTGVRNVTFWWKVDSESTDKCKFFVNGTEITYISGTADWASYSYDTYAGENELKWGYFKDSSADTNNDTCWITAISYDEYEALGNLTSIVKDLGVNDIAKQIRIQGNNPHIGTNITIAVNVSADNSAFTWEELGTVTTIGDFNVTYDISAGNQKRYISWDNYFQTNDSSNTPALYNMTVLYESAAGAEPNITSWTNNYTNDLSTDFSCIWGFNINFNATANQTVTWEWYVNSSAQSHNYNNSTYYFNLTGTKNVTTVISNANGTDSQIWNVTSNIPPEITEVVMIT